MPGLTPRPGVLEDELRKKAVEARPQEAPHQAQDPGVFDECSKRRPAMQAEDLGDPALGLACLTVCQIVLGHDQSAIEKAGAPRGAADRHHVFEHGRAGLRIREARAEKEPVALEALALVFRKHEEHPTEPRAGSGTLGTLLFSGRASGGVRVA